LSYAHLAPVTQRIFALLGDHPGGRFDAPAVAALAELPLDRAEGVLGELVNLHLVEEPEPGLYRLHDLMREYAARLTVDDPVEAVRRLLAHMIDVALQFTRSVEQPLAPGRPPKKAARPDLVAAVPVPLAWLETHRTSFAAVIDAGITGGRPDEAWRLAESVFRFLYTRCYFDDLVQCESLGLAAARAAGDRSGVAQCSYLLAAGKMLRGQLHESLELLHASIDTYLELGDVDAANRVRSNTSGVLCMVGRLDEAWEMSLLAVDGWWRSGLGHGWQGLIAAGEAAMIQGRHADALRALRLLWTIGTYVRDPVVPALALGFLGQVRLRMGRPRLAITLIEAGMRGKDRANYRVGVVGDLSRLAVAHRELGDLAAAVDRHERALRLLAELDEARWESVVCNDYAGTLRAAGDAEGALALYRRALPAAQRSGIAYEQARALAGIGDRPRALAIFERMGVPERFEVGNGGVDPLRESGSGSRMKR
jgi:tetratricopeptide (TPR) repeat protein